MTTTTHAYTPQGRRDQFGRRVAARLAEGCDQLPHEVAERLRAARVRAAAQRKLEVVVPARGYALAAGGGLFDDRLSLWGRLASALPAVLLAGGLVVINGLQDQLRANEVAEVDAALLTDALPPAAYTDPGFVRFLQSGD